VNSRDAGDRRYDAGIAPRHFKRGATGVECLFMTVSQVILQFIKIDINNVLQLFVHTENSEWFSTISVIIFEVNIIAAEQKQAYD